MVAVLVNDWVVFFWLCGEFVGSIILTTACCWPTERSLPLANSFARGAQTVLRGHNAISLDGTRGSTPWVIC